jgi:dTDP-4-dehydrorhamnose 3,5-epimerase
MHGRPGEFFGSLAFLATFLAMKKVANVILRGSEANIFFPEKKNIVASLQMNIISTDINGLLIIEPTVHADDRGYFFETYHASRYTLPDAHPFMQDNEAKSNKGVLRGLHFQTGEHAQGKLVRVITGAVYDVAVDIRPDSDTYGISYGLILSGENKRQLWIPRGFAHGYLVMEDNTIFSYKCDNYYHKAAEQGIRYDDPELAINWPALDIPFLVSEKDLALGYLSALSL